MGGFDTFRRFGHQGQADAAGAGVHTMGLARQQALHEKLFSSIFTLNEKLSLSSATVDSATLRFLKDWLVEHIVKEDMEIGDFMKRQAGASDRAATGSPSRP